MRQNDLLKSDSGDHLRVLLYGDQQSYVVNCQRCKMPFPISTPSLLQMEKLPQDTYRLLALDEDISECQRQQRDRRAELIAPLMVEECICDKSYRNKVLREIVSNASTSRKTVLQYLWLYWVYQSKNALLPAEKSNAEKRPLSSDEKTIRWALNKFYYTPQRQSLQTAYKMMLRAKYCDAKGKLKPDYPSFWQFRYFFRQHRDPISESISREGIKAYQRNYRPFVGAVSDYAGTIGTYMTDATVADIYIVSRLSRRPIGRPVIYTMVDAYSRLITGVYVGIEGGQYALRLLLQNTFADKVSFCRQHNIEIDPQDWPSHHLPTKIMTDRGSEFLGGPLENLCESYGIEIENLPAYRPDLKGVVEKLFDLVQNSYKPLLKGKGVIESDTQERGAPDYRGQGTLDLEQFTAIVLRCVLFYNSQYIQTGFIRTPNMASAGIMPTAAQKTFAVLMQDALTASYDFCGGGGYRAIIKRALRNRGYASVTGGRIYAARIAEAVNAFYGGNFESVDSNEIYGVASNNRTVSVRKILQLACFLGLSLSDLLAPPPEDNTLAEIREMYQQGVSMYHIAQLYGTDRKTVARWVKP